LGPSTPSLFIHKALRMQVAVKMDMSGCTTLTSPILTLCTKSSGSRHGNDFYNSTIPTDNEEMRYYVFSVFAVATAQRKAARVSSIRIHEHSGPVLIMGVQQQRGHSRDHAKNKTRVLPSPINFAPLEIFTRAVAHAVRGYEESQYSRTQDWDTYRRQWSPL